MACNQAVAAGAAAPTVIQSAFAPPLCDADRKRLATLAARAALASVQLFTIEGDNGRPLFVATRWALTRSFEDLDAVSRWLDMVGAPAA